MPTVVSSSVSSSQVSHSTQQKSAYLRTKWLTLAPTGLVLLGSGVSLIGEALHLKIAQAGFWEWFGWGTLALVVFNAGVVVFGEAVKCRVMHEMMHHEQVLKPSLEASPELSSDSLSVPSGASSKLPS
jgi:hypothetical protein